MRAQGTSATPFPKQPADPPLKFGNSYSSAFYVRIRFRDQIGIIQSVGEVFATSGVPIYNLLQVRPKPSTLPVPHRIAASNPVSSSAPATLHASPRSAPRTAFTCAMASAFVSPRPLAGLQGTSERIPRVSYP